VGDRKSKQQGKYDKMAVQEPVEHITLQEAVSFTVYQASPGFAEPIRDLSANLVTLIQGVGFITPTTSNLSTRIKS
jgi:hypothetical protein